MSTVQDSDKKWVMAAKGHAPHGSLVGGHDTTGETIYVARASHKGDVIPGKLITSHGCAFISWNGEEIRKTEYEVLVGSSNKWIATSGSNTPPGAFPGGKIKDGEKFFVGRVHHEGSITTGKIQESHGACYIPYGGLLYSVGSTNNWIPTIGNNLPCAALPGGQIYGGEALFIGRVRHEGSITTGKVQVSHGVCHIPYGGKELSFTEYEFLTS